MNSLKLTVLLISIVLASCSKDDNYNKKHNIKMTFYQDIDGYNWMYLQDKMGQAISSELSNKSFHLEFIN